MSRNVRHRTELRAGFAAQNAGVQISNFQSQKEQSNAATLLYSFGGRTVTCFELNQPADRVSISKSERA